MQKAISLNDREVVALFRLYDQTREHKSVVIQDLVAKEIYALLSGNASEASYERLRQEAEELPDNPLLFGVPEWAGPGRYCFTFQNHLMPAPGFYYLYVQREVDLRELKRDFQKKDAKRFEVRKVDDGI